MPTDDGNDEEVDRDVDHARDDEGDDESADWRDEYIDEQLDEHDAGEPIGPGPQPMSRFRHGSLGVTLGAAMTGLGNVLEPRKKEEAPVIVDHDEPDRSRDPIELHLDADNPAGSVVIIRKWVEEHPERAERARRDRDDNEEGPA